MPQLRLGQVAGNSPNPEFLPQSEYAEIFVKFATKMLSSSEFLGTKEAVCVIKFVCYSPFVMI